MDRDTRKLALVSVIFGIAVITLAPARAGLLDALSRGTFLHLPGPADFLRGARESDFADMLLNVLLFLPLGWFLAARDASRSRPWVVPLIAAALGLLLSGGVEVIQSSIPGRWPSLTDVLFNALGAGIGARLAASFAPPAGNVPD